MGNYNNDWQGTVPSTSRPRIEGGLPRIPYGSRIGDGRVEEQ